MWNWLSEAVQYMLLRLSSILFHSVTQPLFDAIKDVEIGELIRPLSYALNSSLCASICNHDLAYNHGSIGPQLQVCL